MNTLYDIMKRPETTIWNTFEGYMRYTIVMENFETAAVLHDLKKLHPNTNINRTINQQLNEIKLR